MKNKIYEEVKCDYHTDGFWVVDAWYHNNDEGVVVALINDITGDCYAVRNLDDQCKGVIEEKQMELVYKRSELLADAYNDLYDHEKDEFLRLTGNQ